MASVKGDRLRVAIVGGGIGGVAAALFLHRAGVSTRVFEQADRYREVGAGIQISPNAVRLLERLGIGPALAAVSASPEIIWQFHKWQTGETIFEQRIDDSHRAKWGAPYYLIHRAKLLNILSDALPPGTLELNNRVTDVHTSQTGCPATVEHADGSRSEFDLVIIADGIHSPLRAKLFQFEPPKYSGYYAFRALADMKDVPLPERPSTMAIWLGQDRHFVHYPIDGGKVLNLVCAVPEPTWEHAGSWADGTIDEFRDAFAGWHPTVDALISAAKTTRKFALYYRDPLPYWTQDNVALLGDAAHPMLSFFAQGSGQAIEDAAVLSMCLEGKGRDEIGIALNEYESIRKPRASAIQNDANARIHGYHFPDGPEQVARDKRLSDADPMTANGWVYEHDVMRDVANMRGLLPAATQS